MPDQPALIGRYQIDATLGQGAMGVIYRAHDPEIDRVVAIKLIRADLLNGTEREEYVERFRREARAAGRCLHPNIVTVYDFALHDGNPFLVMEFVDGATLADAMRHTPRFDPADAVFVTLQVLAALTAAHATGVVHRDIKPANVMLVGGTLVKVTDFGISRIDSAITHSGAVVGTPSYMSPEQARGGAIDLRTDLFSAGVMLFEMLAGQKPFRGNSFSELWNVLAGPSPADPAPLHGVTPDLVAVVMRSLDKNIEARFANAAAMAEALRQAITETGISLSDRTIVVPARPPARAGPVMFTTATLTTATLTTATQSFDAGTLRLLEQKLTGYIGPIARQLVQSAVRRGGDARTLCAALAASIDRPHDRAQFEREATAALARSGETVMTSTGPAGFGITGPGGTTFQLPPEEITRIEAALAFSAGPMARIMVKRAMAKSLSASALWDALAQQIEHPAERAAFLAKR